MPCSASRRRRGWPCASAAMTPRKRELCEPGRAYSVGTGARVQAGGAGPPPAALRSSRRDRPLLKRPRQAGPPARQPPALLSCCVRAGRQCLPCAAPCRAPSRRASACTCIAPRSVRSPHSPQAGAEGRGAQRLGAERGGGAATAGGHGRGGGPRGCTAAARQSRGSRGGGGPPRRRRGVARVGAGGGGVPPPCRRDGGAGEARLSLHRLTHQPRRAQHASQAGARRDAAAPAAGFRAATCAHEPHAQRAGGSGPPVVGARRGASPAPRVRVPCAGHGRG